MKEELLKKLLEILNNGQSFLVEQLPDVAKQLLQYERISSIAIIIIAFLFAVIFLVLARKLLKLVSEDEGYMVGATLLYALSALAFIIMVYFGTDIVQSYLAPKAYLIKMLTGRH